MRKKLEIGPQSAFSGAGGLFSAPMTQNAFGQNAALCRTHATYVHLIATQEVTGGIILGYLLLAEVPSFTLFWEQP